MALLGKEATDDQTAQPWEHRGADSCWRRRKDGQGAEIGQLQDLRHLNLLVGIAGAIGARAKDQLSC